MDPECDTNSDLRSLSGVTLADEPGVIVEHDQLIGTGSNFLWYIRIKPPTPRGFSLSPLILNREVIAKLSGRRLPSTITGFREFLNTRYPNAEGRGFVLRCSVWPASPYAIIPVIFATEFAFSNTVEDRSGEIAQRENVAYRRLISGCRKYAMESPWREVVFEIKILLKKDVGLERKGRK